MTTATTIHELAHEGFDWFESAERPDGGRFYRLKDGAPEWLSDLVREAHGDFLPDDWRYEAIMDALSSIADAGEDAEEDSHEFADRVDIYTGSLVEWLGSNARRAGYCDEAQDEGLAEDGVGVVKLIQLGQYMERQEVYSLVWRGLEDLTA